MSCHWYLGGLSPIFMRPVPAEDLLSTYSRSPSFAGQPALGKPVPASLIHEKERRAQAQDISSPLQQATEAPVEMDCYDPWQKRKRNVDWLQLTNQQRRGLRGSVVDLSPAACTNRGGDWYLTYLKVSRVDRPSTSLPDASMGRVSQQADGPRWR